MPPQAWTGLRGALLAAWHTFKPYYAKAAETEPAASSQAWAELWSAILAAWGPPVPEPPPGGPTQASGTAAHRLDLHCRRVIGGAVAALPGAAAKRSGGGLLNAHRKALLARSDPWDVCRRVPAFVRHEAVVTPLRLKHSFCVRDLQSKRMCQCVRAPFCLCFEPCSKAGHPFALKMACCGRCKVSSMAEGSSSSADAADVDGLAAEFDAQCQALLQTCSAADDDVH